MTVDPARRLRNRLVPGMALLDDKETWEPVVPYDIDAPPPPVAADGTAACERCARPFPLAQLNITRDGYRCQPCANAELVPPTPVDVDNVKVGRGRWWLMPIVLAIGGAITIVAPAVALVVTLVGMAVVFRFFLRPGL